MRFGMKLIGAVLGLALITTPAFTLAADWHQERHDDRGGRPAIHGDVHVREVRGDRDRDRDRVTFDRWHFDVVVPAPVRVYAPDCR